jgi:hypothetical protein
MILHVSLNVYGYVASLMDTRLRIDYLWNDTDWEKSNYSMKTLLCISWHKYLIPAPSYVSEDIVYALRNWLNRKQKYPR